MLPQFLSDTSSFLGHPWICENGVAPDRALDPAVLSRLKQFSAMNKLKKMALRVSAHWRLHYLLGTSEIYFAVIGFLWKGHMNLMLTFWHAP